MPVAPADMPLYLQYLTPPALGAFIGYITNKIAIKMLFRPLKAWRVLGLRIPMTPGVIPSKRYEFAANMGEMVGDHLLTSKEIGHALTQPTFQQHLYSLIEERVGNLLHRELGPVSSVVPQKFQIYFDLAVKTVRFQIKDHIHTFIQSPGFAHRVEESINRRLEQFLSREVGSVLHGHERENAYRFLEEGLARMLSGSAMQQWLEEFLQQKIYGIIQQDRALRDVLPAPVQQMLFELIERETPNLLLRLSAILKEPDVRDRLVKGATGGVDSFISSMGPMAVMARGFLNMETVEQKIRDYLDSKEEDISGWLQSEEVRNKVAEILSGRFRKFLEQPISSFLPENDNPKIEEFCRSLSERLMPLLQQQDVHAALASMLKTNFETYIDGGSLPIRKALVDLVGRSSLDKGRAWIVEEGTALLRSRETIATLDPMIETMLDALLQKPIGRLSNLLPADVREEIYRSIQAMASNMLASEVPGLVSSLNIKKIVAEKINSLDLLRLEKLLLSIMEEQFKYINLFGAILGFAIGCLNLLFSL